MKQILLKRIAIAAIALCAVPGTLLAQQENDKGKTNEKKDRQQIIITRTGDKDAKTIIEIDGDKVKVNGKDVADLKDIQVRVNNLKVPNITAMRTPNGFSMTIDDAGHGGMSLFSVDSNRAMLGVVTESDEKGAEIQSITKESAAEKAGLKKGDIITKINNRKIDDADDVTDAIRAQKPGDKISITYLRDGKEQKTNAELGRWKGIDVKNMTSARVLSPEMWRESLDNRTFDHVPMPGNVFASTMGRPKLGLVIQDTDDGKGVKVIDVDSDGNAAKAGIKEDDIITHVNGEEVKGADDIKRLVTRSTTQTSHSFKILRNGKEQTIEVKMPRKLKTVDL